MIFSTVAFILYFLAPLLVIYYLVPGKIKNPLLLAASVVFLALCGLRLFLIPIAAAAVNYFYGMLLSKHRTKPILFAGAAINVLLIVIFRLLMKSTDILYIAPDMLLFCGMCYGAMRGITYLGDIYAGTTAMQKNPVKFGLYMLYFPLFASGPVIKYNDFRRLMADRKLIGIRFLGGAGLFLCGLLKKVIIADRLRLIWQTIFSYDFTGLSLVNAWLGLIALGLYIYFMFASFWDMGVGISRMLGIDADRRVRPIRYFTHLDLEKILRLAPVLAGFICVMSVMSMKGITGYAAALFRGSYIGWGEQDFMYRLTSNLGLLLLSVIIASGVIRFLIEALRPAKMKNTKFANIASLVIMALLIAAGAVNLISLAKAPVPEDNGSALDGTFIRAADTHIAQNSFFTQRLFHINADIGYLLGQKGLNGVHYTKDSRLIERPKPYNEGMVDRYIEGVDSVLDIERYTTYIAAVPPAFEIMKHSLKPYTYDDRVLKVTHRISELLSDSDIRFLDCTDALISSSDEKIYRSTDSSLTHKGRNAVYKALGELLGYTPGRKETMLAEHEDIFRGDLWSRAGLDTTEPDSAESINELNAPYTERTDGISHTFSSDAGNGRALVIVTDGYGFGIPNLLADSFDVVYHISASHSAEEVKQFIDERYVTDVLYLVGTETILNGGYNE